MTRRVACAIAALAFLMILWGTLMPVAQKDGLLSPFPDHWHLDKVGHFVGFGVLAAALYRSGLAPAQVLASVFLLGATTEWLQGFADGRISLVSDVVIDTLGGGTGLVLALFLRRRARRGDERRPGRL